MVLLGKKDTKTKQAQVVHLLLGSGLSLLSGILFTYIIGVLDSSQYLLEQMSIVLIELPFVVCYAVLVRKYDWLICCAYAFLGTAASFALIFPGNTVTPLVFLKISFMGIILGKYNWLSGSFLRRISAVAIPGIIIAFVFGLPIIINGVSPEIIEETKQDTLKIYQALILSWLSFLLASWVMGKIKESAEYVPPFYTFKIPFHAIWVLLAGGLLFVSGYKPSIPMASNILAVMAGLYGIQGLAIVTYHINGISIGRLPKVLFWLIFFMMIGFFSVFLIIVGVLDNWFNLRSFTYYISGGEEGNNNESNS